MLHCLRVTLPRIDGTGELALHAPVPADLRALYLALGGDAATLDAL
jgi:hypothetical protein